ncbi:epididymal-specific lipocalin-8-like protein [Cricetulus griseus]|nr:epididymal-specific lipocalin-8-like protein [Cricetulus griseus]
MEARLLNTIWRLFLVYLLQAESTRVDLVPEKGRNFHVLKYFTRSLEIEDEPGFWRFREMTADQGHYMLARHGRCAELLKEVAFAANTYDTDYRDDEKVGALRVETENKNLVLTIT